MVDRNLEQEVRIVRFPRAPLEVRGRLQLVSTPHSRPPIAGTMRTVRHQEPLAWPFRAGALHFDSTANSQHSPKRSRERNLLRQAACKVSGHSLRDKPDAAVLHEECRCRSVVENSAADLAFRARPTPPAPARAECRAAGARP